MLRRTTIAAAATALALLGGGSALAATAGLFTTHQPDGAGSLPAVSSPDPGTPPATAGNSATLPAPSAATGDEHENGGGHGRSGEGAEAERDD